MRAAVMNYLVLLVVYACALAGVGLATANDAARERRADDDTTVRTKPKIVTKEGNLEFQSATNHNITFDMSGTGDVYLGKTSVKTLVDQVTQLQKDLDEFRVLVDESPCTKNINVCNSGACVAVSKTINATGYRCLCGAAFTGSNCETVIQGAGTCLNVICFNGGQCRVLNGVPECGCSQGWFGQRCELQMPSTCSYDITETQGVIKSPGFPTAYPANTDCIWKIHTKPGKTFRFMFNGLGLEQSSNCTKDSLKIYDGLLTTDPLLGTFCGSLPPVKAVQSHGSDVLITMNTDAAMQIGAGFSLTYFEGPSSICGAELTEDSGVFSSPNWPYAHNSSLSCTWRIIVPEGETLSLDVSNLVLSGSGASCSTNGLLVYDGADELSPLVGNFCASAPGTLISTSNQLYIKFVSDGTGSLFRATYETRCGGQLTAGEGTIKSPYFPGFYPHKKRCVWNIVADEGYVIRTDFLAFDIEPSVSCIYDYVAFINGPSIGSGPLVNQTCGSTSPSPVVSTMNALTVVFQTDGSHSFRGFSLRYQRIAGGCGGVLTGTSGIITSPLPLLNSSHSVRCIWTMVTPIPGEVIRLRFTSFVLEPDTLCRYDFIRLHDGSDETTPTLYNTSASAGRFCGIQAPPLTYSSSNALTLAFFTDRTIPSVTFTAVWTSGPLVCNHSLNALQGEFTSPRYPLAYPHFANCFYSIQVTPGSQIDLQFPLFSLEHHEVCNFDKLTIYDGGDTSAPIIGLFCGIRTPGRIVSTGNMLLIRFQTDSTGSAPGFRATYTTGINLCGGDLHSPSGFIRSLGYPQPYPNLMQCDWTINTLPGNTVVATISDLNVESSFTCALDFLQLRDGPGRDSTQLAKLCGNNTQPSLSFRSTNNSMFVRFQSDIRGSGRGFEIRYESGCGGELTALNGELRSPNFGISNYPTHRACNWTIRGKQNDVVRLSFTSFNLEPGLNCSFDSLAIYDGPDANSPRLRLLCGALSQIPAVVSTSNVMFIAFKSDISLTRPGFLATYTLQGCSEELTNSTGSFTSPLYPANYPHLSDCSWKITIPQGNRISLTFSEINIEDHVNCSFDYVMVFNGPDANAPLVGRYCSQRPTFTLTSSSNQFYIVFKSDGSNAAKGFSASYNPVPDGCGGTFTAESGFFNSPGYPQPYPSSAMCEWTLLVPFGQVVRLTFLDFDLELSNACQNDYVEVFDGLHSNTSVSLLKACGSSINNTVLQSTSFSMFIRFKSDQGINGKGFRASYETGCGGTINVDTSTRALTSPFYPRNYDHNSNCNWLLSAPAGEQISLTFTNLDIELFANCTFDYIEVFLGDNDQAPRAGRFCGRHVPAVIRSFGNRMFIRFRTDSTSSRPGFRAVYTHSRSACGGALSGDTGAFNSPLFPATTPLNANCVWTITANAGSAIQVSFRSFNLLDSATCPSTYLLIEDGLVAGGPSLLPRSCGSNMPATVTSTQSQLRVQFVGSSVRSPGFEASFTTMCSRTLTATSGAIESPGYPGPYPHNKMCSWVISAPAGQTISLQFEAMDMEEHLSCLFDYLEIRNGNTASSPLIGFFCGTALPGAITSTDSFLFIRFVSDFNSGGNGFRLMYSVASPPPACGGMLTATNSMQYVDSPNFPNNYPNNLACEYVITSPGTHTIMVNIIDFRLQDAFFFCLNDVFQIRDGPTVLSQTIAILCGQKPLTTTFRSSGNSIHVRFTSDGSNPPPATGDIPFSFRFGFIQTCGGELTADSGRITAPTTADSYGANHSCSWTINLAAGDRILLNFAFIDMEDTPGCTNDYLEIRSGLTLTSPVVSRLCSPQGALNMTLFGHQALFTFVTNDAVHGRGFDLQYSRSLACSEDVRITDPSVTAAVTSPNYPAAYPHRALCDTVLTVPSGQTVRLVLTNMDIEIASDCIFDYVEFRDGATADSPLLQRTCGRSLANVIPIISTGNQLFVRFRSDTSSNGAGFRATWGIGCGGTFATEKGLIQSPNFPSAYPPNSNCEYIIQLPTNRRLQLRFNTFSLQASTPCQDYVKIYDGTSRNSTVLDTICSSTLPSPILSSGRGVLIEFQSDASTQLNGYQISFTAFGAACGSRLTSTTGTIMSPNFPSFYPSARVCEWVIAAGDFRAVQLYITTLDIQPSLNCTMDYVEVFGGEFDSSPSLGRFCGNNPVNVSSAGNRMMIRFVSNRDSLLARGFTARYETDHPGCGGHLFGASGNLTSLNYPDPYPPSADCEYTITVPTGTVAIKFNDFALEAGFPCIFDYVQIRNGPTSEDHLVTTLCNTMGQGYNYTTVHQTIYLRFVSDPLFQQKGFHMSWSNTGFGRAQCGGEVTSSLSVLETPGYPVSYPNDVDCAWLVTVPVGRRITAVAVDFDLEPSVNCTNDYLAVYNGDSADAPLIIRLCGTLPGLVPPFVSSGRSLFVVLHTNSQLTGRGARATFNASIPGCGQMLTDSSGVLTSPGYPNSYPSSAECDWTIRQTDNVRISILFDQIDIEAHINCIFDYLEIFDGPDRNSPSLGRYCGTSHPSPITSSGNTVYILLRSDSTAQRTGFKLNYTTGCGGSIFSKTGVIMSPNFPSTYPINSQCDWHVRHPTNSKIELQYSDFNLPPADNGRQCSADYVQHMNTSSANVADNQRFCGTTAPPLFDSKSNELDVRFTSDGVADAANSGFRGTFRSVCGGEITAPTGTISSHLISGTYLNHEDCTYIVRVPVGSRISYGFTSFSIETHFLCSYDYVELRDGDNASSPLIGKFCGSIPPPRYQTTGNTLYLRFVTDLDITQNGFTFAYGIAPPGCGGHLLTSTGSIQTSNFPLDYPSNDNCFWTITAPLGMRIEISFSQFQVEGLGGGSCISDYLEIRDGYFPHSPLIQRLCGTILPGNVTTIGNFAFLRFISDFIVQMPGFSLTYRFIPGCGGAFQATSTPTQLTSPSYPANYPANTDCEWVFTSPPGTKVSLTFTDFQLPARDAKNQCSSGALEISDQYYIATTALLTYCGNGPVAPYLSDVHFLRLRLRAAVAAKGFSLTYQVGDCSQQLTASSGTLMSPNYPHRYPMPSNCITTITVEQGHRISVFFKTIKIGSSTTGLSCPTDFLLLRDSNTSTTNLGGKTFCGTSPPPTIITAGNTLYVRFFANSFSRPDTRYLASYTSTNGACGGPLTGDEGALTSPNYPQSYNDQLDCQWTITVSTGKRIQINFVDFHLQDDPSGTRSGCSNTAPDTLELRDGGVVTSQLQGRYCGGSALPPPFLTTTNVAFLRFKTDATNNAFTGFKLDYTAM